MKSVRTLLSMTVLLIAVTPILSCGGAQQKSDGRPTTPQPDLSLSVFPTAAEIDTTLHSPSTVQFTASVSNTSDTRITWKVNGVSGGNNEVGTISSSGLYTAPTSVPITPVNISAVSVADPSKSGSAAVTLRWAVELSLSTPGGGTVPLSGKLPITYFLDTNAPDKRLDWFVNGIAGGDVQYGTIRADEAHSVWYNAPAAMPASAVQVRAVARANSSSAANLGLSLLAANFVVVPMAATLHPGQEAQFQAYLNGIEVSASWTLYGDGSIIGGLYTAPAAVTTAHSVAITGRYDDHVAASVVTVAPEESSPFACINGRYVLAFHTSDSPAGDFLGTISSDGEGHLSGIGDLVTPGFIDEPSYDQLHDQMFAGSYSCTPEGDAMLNITLPVRKPFSPEDLTIHASFLRDGSAYLTVYGDARGSGVMERQMNVPYSNELMAGIFVLSLNGVFNSRCLEFCFPSDYPIAILGLFEAQSSGIIAGSTDYLGSNSSQGSLDGSRFSIDGSGRGTATLQLGQNDSGFNGGTFSIVAVSPDRLFYMHWSPVGPEPFMLRGIVERQAPLESLSFKGPFVFQAGARTGRFVVDTNNANLTGKLDEVSDGTLTEDLMFSSNFSIGPNGRLAGALTIAGEQPASFISYFVHPGKWLIAIGSDQGQAEAQSGMLLFSEALLSGTYFVRYDGGDGWFTRQPPQDGFGCMEHGPTTAYVRVAFLASTAEGKGTVELTENDADGLHSEKVKYYAVSASKLLFTNLKGLTERRN